MQALKQAQGCNLKESHSSDPKFVYLRECNQLDLALPILEKVIGKTLALENYPLSSSHCRAIKQVFEMLSGQIDSIALENCNLEDPDFATVIEGISRLTNLEEIIYKQSSFDTESL